MKARVFAIVFTLFLISNFYVLKSAFAVTFTSDIMIESDNMTYDGEDIVVDNCSLTINGSHSFANFVIINNGIVTHSVYSSNTETQKSGTQKSGRTKLDA